MISDLALNGTRTEPLVEPGRNGEPASRRSQRLPFAVVILGLMVGVDLVVRSATIEPGPASQVAFAAVAVVAFLLILVGALGGRHSAAMRGIVLLWSFYMVVELLQLPSGVRSSAQTGVTLKQGVTDFAVMMVPALLTISIGMWVTSRLQLLKLLMIVFVLAVVASVYPWLTTPAGVRFEAPPNVCTAAAWVFVSVPLPREFSKRARKMIRLTAIGTVLVLLPVILAARSRTALVVWLLCGGLTLVLPGMNRTARWKWALGTSLAVVLCLGTTQLGPYISQQLPKVLQQARLNTLAPGAEDVSSRARLVEVQDVVDTMNQQGSTLDHLVGFGHGATYLPSTSLIAVNIDPVSGRIHNVHITPAMVFLRYGYIGLVLYLVLLASLIVFAIKEFLRTRDTLSALALTLIGAGILDAMVRNSFADAGFALTIAVVLVARRLPVLDRVTDEPA